MEILIFFGGVVIGCVGTIIGYHSAMRSLDAPRKGWEQYARSNGLPIRSTNCDGYVIDSYEGTDCGKCGEPKESHAHDG